MLHRGLGLQDLDLDAVLGQNRQGFRAVQPNIAFVLIGLGLKDGTRDTLSARASSAMRLYRQKLRPKGMQGRVAPHSP